MSANDVWEFLSELQVGTIVAWIIVITSIFGVAVKINKKFLTIIDKYHSTQEEREQIINKLDEQNEKFSKAIGDLSDSVKELDGRLDQIQNDLRIQEGVNLKQIRNNIITICDDAITNKHISERKYQLLTEMNDEYTDVFHANGYVADSVEKVKLIWKAQTGEEAEE